MRSRTTIDDDDRDPSTTSSPHQRVSHDAGGAHAAGPSARPSTGVDASPSAPVAPSSPSTAAACAVARVHRRHRRGVYRRPFPIGPARLRSHPTMSASCELAARASGAAAAAVGPITTSQTWETCAPRAARVRAVAAVVAGQGERRHQAVPLPRPRAASSPACRTSGTRTSACGTVPHQQIGYLFPMGPFFWLFDAARRAGVGRAAVVDRHHRARRRARRPLAVPRGSGSGGSGRWSARSSTCSRRTSSRSAPGSR